MWEFNKRRLFQVSRQLAARPAAKKEPRWLSGLCSGSAAGDCREAGFGVRSPGCGGFSAVSMVPWPYGHGPFLSWLCRGRRAGPRFMEDLFHGNWFIRRHSLRDSPTHSEMLTVHRLVPVSVWGTERRLLKAHIPAGEASEGLGGLLRSLTWPGAGQRAPGLRPGSWVPSQMGIRGALRKGLFGDWWDCSEGAACWHIGRG